MSLNSELGLAGRLPLPHSQGDRESENNHQKSCSMGISSWLLGGDTLVSGTTVGPRAPQHLLDPYCQEQTPGVPVSDYSALTRLGACTQGAERQSLHSCAHCQKSQRCPPLVSVVSISGQCVSLVELKLQLEPSSGESRKQFITVQLLQSKPTGQEARGDVEYCHIHHTSLLQVLGFVPFGYITMQRRI